jgi:pilus assembly protein Flp/PilA
MLQKIGKSLLRLHHDESGTAMIEYSILLGLITVAVIAMIVFVGQWVTNQWSTLSSSLP